MTFDEIDLQWFAAEDEGRTEEPSEYKLRKAREEGRVAKSQELNGALVLIFTVVALVIAAPYFLRWCAQIYVYYFKHCTDADVTQKEFYTYFLLNILRMTGPLALFGIIAGVVGNIIQNRGFLFTTKTITPQFSKIAPNIGQYLRRTLFSFEGGFNVFKSIAKVTFIGIAAYLIISANVPVILKMLGTSNVMSAVGRIAWTGAQILIAGAVMLLAISIPDYFVQKHQFLESMKMTKQEVKQEYKEMEGDPEVKNRLEQARREMLRRNIPKAVAESDVVITNPTHFAVALKYDSKDPGPKVMAKGQDNEAQIIKRYAREDGIPMVENRPLARGLYSQTKIGDIIPNEYFSAIAVIYAQFNLLDKKK